MAKKSGPPDVTIWRKRILGDEAKRTALLSTMQIGALVLLEDVYWTHGPLPNDDETLARVARLSPDDWQRIAPSVRSMFVVDGDRLVSPSLDQEKADAKALSATRSVAGASGAKKRWEEGRSQSASYLDGNDMAIAMANGMASASQVDGESQSASQSESPSQSTAQQQQQQQQQQHAAAGPLSPEVEDVLRLYSRCKAQVFGPASAAEITDHDRQVAVAIIAYGFDHEQLSLIFLNKLDRKLKSDGLPPARFAYMAGAVRDFAAERERLNSQPLIARH